MAALVQLGGCSYSSSEAVTDLPADLKTSAYISSIKIGDMPADATSGLELNIGRALQSALPHCANGPHALRLDVSITRFKPANAAMAMLIGTTADIEGSARLVRPDTGAVVGDYEIATTTGGSGLITAIELEDSERAMSRAFAKDVCKKAFGREVDYDHAPMPSPPLATVQYPQVSAPIDTPLAQPPDPGAPWHETPAQ
jgi:hypothetical protein